MLYFCNSNSSALPSVGEISEMGGSSAATMVKKDTTRKNSVMLPSAGSGMMDGSSGTGKSSSLAAAGSSVIGGIDNYKRYQMLVSQSTVGTIGVDGTNKRSQSLLGENKKFPIKRTVTMNDNNSRKKTSKLS